MSLYQKNSSAISGADGIWSQLISTFGSSAEGIGVLRPWSLQLLAKSNRGSNSAVASMTSWPARVASSAPNRLSPVLKLVGGNIHFNFGSGLVRSNRAAASRLPASMIAFPGRHADGSKGHDSSEELGSRLDINGLDAGAS